MGEAMKVTVIGPVYPYRGGIAHYTARLVQALQEKNIVQTISFRRQYPAWLYPGRTDKDTSQQPIQVEAEFLLDPLFPTTWWQTTRQIARFQPDIAVLPWWTTFWAPALIGLAWLIRRKKIPVLFLVHNVLPHEAHFFDAWLARLAFRRANALIVGTSQQKERLLSLLPGAEVEVFPHPVYDIFSRQAIPREQARKQLGLPDDLRVVLSFGIIRPYKGLKVLIDALAKLRDQDISLSLLVAGEFWEEKAAYTQQIERLGLTGQVYLVDRYISNEEIPIFFGAADVYAAPYTGGSQSGSSKIAMGFGLPLVASQIVVDNELRAMQGKGVYIVAPGEAQELADALVQALQWQPVSVQSDPMKGRFPLRDWDRLANVIERACLRFR